MTNEKIWNKLLNLDEDVKYSFSIGKRYLKISLIIGCVLGVLLLLLTTWFGVIVILGSIFYYGWYLKRANKYAFTNKRILIHKGWLNTKLISVDYDKITDIEVEEPFIERLLFKTGGISINTAGTTLKEIVLKHIETPYETKKELDRLRK